MRSRRSPTTTSSRGSGASAWTSRSRTSRRPRRRSSSRSTRATRSRSPRSSSRATPSFRPGGCARRCRRRRWTRFWRVFSENTTYSQANYEADVESIKGLYNSKGYKDVVVKDPVLDIFVKNPKADAKKLKRAVNITIPIVEGDQYFVNEIRDRPGGSVGQADRGRGLAMVFPQKAILRQVLGAAPGIGPEPRPARRGALGGRGHVQVERLHLLVRRPVVQGGPQPPRGHRREDLRGREVLSSAVSRSRATRPRATRSSAASSPSTRARSWTWRRSRSSLQKLQQLGYFKISEEPDFQVRPDDEEGRRDGEGPGDVAQRGPVRRRLLGRRQVLRPVLLPDPQLPRARRDPRRPRRSSGRSRASTTSPTRSRGSWTRTSRSASRSTATPRTTRPSTRSGGATSVFYGRGIGLFGSWNILYSVRGRSRRTTR